MAKKWVIKLSAKETRTIAAIEAQARDIQFPAALETELRQAATQGREAQELAVAIATKNKPQAYVVAAWKVIDDASKEASARAKRRRPYRRRAAWTMRDQQTAISLAASGDYSVAEIARKLGRSEDAVRLKLQRCGINRNISCNEPSFSQRQLAETLQIHRRVIQEWEALGLSSRAIVQRATRSGKVQVRRRGPIEQEALERFFETSAGIVAASRLDAVSLGCLTILLGYDPVERDNKRQIAAAEHKNAIEAQRKRKKRATEAGAMLEVANI